MSDLTIKVEQILNQAKSGLSNLDKVYKIRKEGFLKRFVFIMSFEKIQSDFMLILFTIPTCFNGLLSFEWLKNFQN